MSAGAADKRAPYWMQQWQAYLTKSGRTDAREYRICDIGSSTHLPRASACAEGVISRLASTALELREPESSLPSYVIWGGLLIAIPMTVLLFHVDVPQSFGGVLLMLWLVCIAVCAVIFGAFWVFTTLKGLLRPAPLNVGFLCDRRNQRLWWRAGTEDRWVAWERIRVVHRVGCPATETTEDLRLLLLNEDDALVFEAGQDEKPLSLMLPAWTLGHQCKRSHEKENEARKAVLDFIAVFMRDGPASLPATRWRTPVHDRERLFLDLARTLDSFAGPRARASRKLRAFCAMLMALAAPLLLPPQWMHALSELRRRPGEWSAATLREVGIDSASPETRLEGPVGSLQLHAPLDREQRALAWIWIASAFAIYLYIGWQLLR